MSNWDEIKRLAADFQKVQLTTTAQRLSERNCIELVNLLIEQKLIDVVHTEDGKEYVTIKQLIKEIKDELYVNGGRVNLVDIAKALNIGLSQVTTQANEIVRTSKDIDLILGQLIDSNYRTSIAVTINDKLQELGEINISLLTLQYDLPSDYILRKIVEKNLGKVILGQQDKTNPSIFYTNAYLLRCKAKIRGVLGGVTHPMSVATILNICKVPENMLYSVMDQKEMPGTIKGKMPGAWYFPHVYSKAQTDWVRNFYKQNTYLEYDSLNRLGISDAKLYIEKSFPGDGITYLNTCAVGPRYSQLIEAAVEECISSNSYVDVGTLLPTVFTKEDIDELLQIALTGDSFKHITLFDCTILSTPYLEKLITPSKSLSTNRVQEYVDSGKYQKYLAEKQTKLSRQDDDSTTGDAKSDRREERRRKAQSGKAGGGTQGRETKTRSTKKHTRGSKNVVDSDDEHEATKSHQAESIEFISLKEVQDGLKVALKSEGHEELVSELSEDIFIDIHKKLNKEALVEANSLFEEKIKSKSSVRRNNHSNTQEKLNVMLNDIRLFDKGVKNLSPEAQPIFRKYLLKTLCNDMANVLTCYIAAESGFSPLDEENLTIEERIKIINDLNKEYKPMFLKTISTLSGSSVEDFSIAAEECVQLCGMIVKKVDKKKDRATVHSHKIGLLDKLSSSQDPALTLYLVCLIIFTTATQTMLHASGKHITDLLTFLKDHVSEDQYSRLRDYQQLVMKFLNAGSDTPVGQETGTLLEEGLATVKEVATSYKKTGVS